jgi:hypothetical protein
MKEQRDGLQDKESLGEARPAELVESGGQDGLEWYGLKLCTMLGLIAIDLGLNSSLEFDLYRANSDIALIMFG